jgi:phosphoglycerate dehydrogenase-like enzyme
LASARHIVGESGAVRGGFWQASVGRELRGKVLGVLGLGNIGREVARIGSAFGMEVVAWSENMTRELAQSAGATLVTKNDLFRQADVLTVHVILSKRTRGLVGAAEIQAMKPTAWLINASRGPIVDEAPLIEALRSRAIAGAALDVFDEEPLPQEHPFRSLDNVLATPHIGYVSEEMYRTFYGDVVTRITAWMDEHPNADS